MEYTFLACLWYVWGSRVLLFFIISAYLESLILEEANYLEHYGLVRKEIAPGM